MMLLLTNIHPCVSTLSLIFERHRTNALISTHICTHVDDDMSICWKAQVIMQLNVRALNYFDDCSLMLR